MYTTKLQRLLISVLLAAVFFGVNIKFLFMPRYEEDMANRNTIKTKVIEINDLRNNTSQAKLEENARKQKYLNEEFKKINVRLPNYLTPEYLVQEFTDLSDYDKVEINGFGFTDPAKIDVTTIKKNYSQSDPKMGGVKNLLAEFFKNTDNKVAAKTNEIQDSNIGDDEPFSVNVSFATSGTYDQVMKFLRDLERDEKDLRNDKGEPVLDDNNKIVQVPKNAIKLTSVSLSSGDKGDNIKASVSASLYGYKDSMVPVYSTWDSKGFEKGTNKNIFSKDSAANFNINDSNNSDFDIYLSPVTFDVPSVIMGKHGNSRSQIYGDNGNKEELNLTLEEKDGEYYYSYRSNNMTFPSNGSKVKFTPVRKGQIIIKVFSTDSVGPTDNAGANLTIYNKIKDRPTINVVKYSDSQAQRFNYKEVVPQGY